MSDGSIPPPSGRQPAYKVERIFPRSNHRIGEVRLVRTAIAGTFIAAEIAMDVADCVVRGILTRHALHRWTFRTEVLPPRLAADREIIEADILDMLLSYAPDFFNDAVEQMRPSPFRDALEAELLKLDSANWHD